MLHHPISFKEYRKLPGISNSILKLFGRTAAHALWGINHPPEPTDAMHLGSLTDHLLFGTEFAYAISPYPDFRATAAKEWKLAQVEAGIVPLKSDVVEDAKAMVASIKGVRQAADILNRGRSQIGLSWDIDVDGCPIATKGLVDWVSDEVACMTDLKTTEDASPQAFSKHIVNMGYDAQAALYVDLWEHNTGEELPWTWIVAETSPPYPTAVYVASPGVLARGRRVYKHLLERYAKALNSNEWDGYPQEAVLIDLPEWAK